MAEQPVHHSWAPITDLGDDDFAAASSELPALMSVWNEHRRELPERRVKEFNDRLNREWAIETGIIERLYTIDEGTTRLMIERGIDASLIAHDDNGRSPEIIAGMIRDHQEAVEWLFDVVLQQRPLSTSFIKELHAFITRKQTYAEGVDLLGRPRHAPLTHGAYKKRPNNPTRRDGKVHEYCPYEHVDAEMERLVELHAQHADTGVPPDLSAAWLHHRFIQVHPFEDGNGRVARALASLVLIRAEWFPLVVNRKDRSKYIDTLESADAGDMAPFTRMIGSLQKQACLAGLSILGDVHREDERLEQMLDAIEERYRSHGPVRHAGTGQTKLIATYLRGIAEEKFADVRAGLESRGFAAAERRVSVSSGGDDTGEQHWFRYQVVETAKSLDYFANLDDYHTWVRLTFTTESGRSEILLSFHTVGHESRDLVGACMCFYRRQQAHDIKQQVTELQTVSESLFQLDGSEPPEAALRRFGPWLADALIMGLDQWRRGE